MEKTTVETLAAECSVGTKKIFAELRRLGLYVASPTTTIDPQLAERIRKDILSPGEDGEDQNPYHFAQYDGYDEYEEYKWQCLGCPWPFETYRAIDSPEGCPPKCRSRRLCWPDEEELEPPVEP